MRIFFPELEDGAAGYGIGGGSDGEDEKCRKTYPEYSVLCRTRGWITTLQALIIPNLIPAFGIFWMTQYCRGAIHDDLLNAGRIDGCGTFRLFWNIGFPIMIPGLSFLAIHTFVSSWNDFLWPLIVLNDQKVYTVQVALVQLQGMFTKTDYGAVMCGTLLATLPVVIIFLICNKFFIAGIAAGGVKD